MDDADIAKAAQVVTMNGFSNAGQVCISAQRILVSSERRSDFLDLLKPNVEALHVGDQLDGETKVGPLVRQQDAERVEQWIQEAAAGGATLVTGGSRNISRRALAPTFLINAGFSVHPIGAQFARTGRVGAWSLTGYRGATKNVPTGGRGPTGPAGCAA